MDGNISKGQRAQVLVQALPYIQKYWNKIVVVKYGGNAMVSNDLKAQVMEDIVLLSLVGVKIVLIHGGGPEITETLEKLGKPTKFVDGLRVTDRETADIVQMVLAGKVNKSLVNLLEMTGGRAMGISGIDGRLIMAKPKSEALGFVGEISSVNVQPIIDLLEKGYIPVVSTVGCDAQGNIYNINADSAAARISGAMGAECLISMTDIAGIMENRDDPNSLIPLLDIAGAYDLMRSGVVSGGMVPKVESCIEAVLCGVKKVFILDGRVPHSILVEMLTDEGAGTMVVEAEL
ncbi:MAG: acetylglutamate kinase [Clostridia bacterium]|nr:acetylglutamate kinase [Clostridia bacterium]